MKDSKGIIVVRMLSEEAREVRCGRHCLVSRSGRVERRERRRKETLFRSNQVSNIWVKSQHLLRQPAIRRR